MQEGGFLQPVPKVPLHITSFPPEVLLRIFRATVPPWHECDPSVMRPWNPWLDELRFRKNLVLVCKAFAGPATAVLYEDIVLRRMGQIPALASTLSSGTGRALGPLIRHIRIDSCVIWAPCADVVREDVMYVLRQCPALCSFAFHPHPNFPTAHSPREDDAADAWDGFNPDWVLHDHTDEMGRLLQDKLAAGLRELDISMTLSEVQVVELHGLLSAASSLRTLKLGPVNTPYGFVEDRSSLPPLELPRLEQLQMYVDHAPFTDYVACKWVLPSLTDLTAIHCGYLPDTLLEAHGRRLTYLHISPEKKDRIFDYSWKRCLLEGLSFLSSWCPVLEHLVFPASGQLASASHIIAALRSPTLRFLDIWCHTCSASRESVEAETARARTADRLPALVRIRRLRKVPRVELPVVCHPAFVEGDDDDDARLRRFPGMFVVQTAWCVAPDIGLQRDLPWFVHLPPEEDESGTFVYESESGSAEGEDEKEDGEIGEDDEGEGAEGASDEGYDPSDNEIVSSEGSSETDDSEAQISEWELDVPALKEARLKEVFDRETVLGMFRASQKHDGASLGDSDEPLDGETAGDAEEGEAEPRTASTAEDS
ncbi:hypothetical protein BD310DRAFT_974602 [Dichomitus squalens]|uniref:F-box domain-containing protein n=1 Tax=Dichomitus squalens TaxID=114155 RepID=A0A4Q9Q3Z7_9APHY|nr:hypothetical protein BD310DRAFT_974602 [Dichomitus squalens]